MLCPAKTINMKQVIIIIVFLVCALQTIAQKGSITGRIFDPQKKGIALATVTVFNAADTSIITYRLSNEKGEFKIPGLPKDQQLRFLVTYSGYEAYRQAFRLTDSLPGMQYDSILMVPSQKQLDEVVVMSERPPVTIKNDTIEFNANSFKTLPNAIVEDLLKKLPGVQVDKDGNITVNGKPVNRMLVDGKNFFGSDPKMASRNLPANIIDKIQVTDDKEELARSSDNNVNNVGKVVNITLKKGVKKGVFGKVYAGLGTDDRYEGGGIVNLFRDTLQVSLLGYANNLNKPGFGFSELMESGGLERSNSNLNSRSTSISSNSSGGSSISVNGINFGGMQRGGGIAESKGVGININHAPNLRQSIFGQYFYGNVLVDKLVSTNVKQYNGDTIITNNTRLNGKVLTNAHNLGLGIKLKPDSVTTFQASANYTIGLQDERTISLVDSYNNLAGKSSDGRIDQSNEADNHYYRHAITYTRLSKQKKGRRISAYQNLDVNKGINAFNTDSRTTYINPNPYDTVLAQLRDERIPRTDASAGLMVRNPLNDRFALTLTSRYEYSKLNNRVNTFGQDSAGDKANIIASLSSNFSRLSQRFQNTAGLEFKYRKLTATGYIRALWQKIDNDLATLPAPIKQNRFDALPSLSIVYGKLNVYYDKGITLPSYSYLIPVLNNSNPYYIVKGNPGLIPAERNNFSTNFYFNDPKKKLNINLNGNFAFIKNDVVQRITVDDNGIQTHVAGKRQRQQDGLPELQHQQGI